MKRLFLSIVLFVGVGFAMMGCPAQVCDDNGGNDKIGTAVQSVTNTPMAPVHQGRDCFKHEWKVKENVDFTKMKKTITPGPRLSLTSKQRTPLQGPDEPLGKPARPRKPGESCSPSHSRDFSKYELCNNNMQFDVSELNATHQETPAGDNIVIRKPKPNRPPGKGCGVIGGTTVELKSFRGLGKESLSKNNPKPGQSTE